MRYTVVLERESDGGFVVSVPALPGCVSQGDTRAEALANIQEAIEVYIADCREAGDPERALTRWAANASTPAFAAMWDNPEDDLYDCPQ